MKAESLVRPVLEQAGLELVGCELVREQGGWILRVFIDKEGGVIVDDCATASRAISGVLDVDDVVPARYNLEVSSPGLNRPLSRPEDFDKFKGQKIKLRTTEPIDGRGNYHGVLLGMRGNDILVNVDGTEYAVPMEKLQKARLAYEFPHKNKKEGSKRR